MEMISAFCDFAFDEIDSVEEGREIFFEALNNRFEEKEFDSGSELRTSLEKYPNKVQQQLYLYAEYVYDAYQ